MCHGCGVVYAARRPAGPRYRDLLSGFHENLGRVGTTSPWLNPASLTEADREQIRERARAGALVSEHANVPDREWIPGAFRDRLAVAQHVEIISSLLTLERPRVLEIRSRTGAMLDALRRLYGASVYALPIFESQQELVRSLYGIPADALVDFERFRIPYEGAFDLVVSNHMLTHSLAPGDFLDTIAGALAPGGHLYLYNEMDEGEYLGTTRSMFQAMNPFHMQLFNAATLQRALTARGFEAVFIGHSDRIHLVCLARKAAPAAVAMPDRERKRRLRDYAASRDVSILALPADRRDVVGDEWERAVERAVLAGAASLDERGRPQIARTRRKGGDPEPYDEGNG
jgi:SAM-dependent methyltransferase